MKKIVIRVPPRTTEVLVRYDVEPDGDDGCKVVDVEVDIKTEALIGVWTPVGLRDGDFELRGEDG